MIVTNYARFCANVRGGNFRSLFWLTEALGLRRGLLAGRALRTDTFPLAAFLFEDERGVGDVVLLRTLVLELLAALADDKGGLAPGKDAQVLDGEQLKAVVGEITRFPHRGPRLFAERVARRADHPDLRESRCE